MKRNCCMLLTPVGFQLWSKFHRNGSKGCCADFASHVRNCASPLLARLTSLVVRASPAACASWARNKLECWTFILEKVGDTEGNCDYTKHNGC